MRKRSLLAGICICALLWAPAARGRTLDTLEKGSTGQDVVRLQTRLMDLGYNTYKPTGSFQSLTVRCVNAYQAAAGQTVTGSLSAEEQVVLYSQSAPIAPFSAVVPLTFTAQSPYFVVTGEEILWERVKGALTPGMSVTLTNCATGESCQVLYLGGEGHAEVDASAAAGVLTGWLGSSNSFYKAAVTARIENTDVAASLQWDGSSRGCLYFSGSVSHVNNLSDAEHSDLVKRAAGK